MSTHNTNTNNATKTPYGHFLDKYLEPSIIGWEEKQQREKEAETRYGHLLDYAKPDNSVLEHIAKMEDDRIKRQKHMEEVKRLEALRRQERIEAARRKEDEHNARVREFGESFTKRKQARIKAIETARQKEREEEEGRQRMHSRIEELMKISPEAADAYIQAMKKGRAI